MDSWQNFTSKLYSIFFLNFFFHRKKIFLKIKKYFFRKISDFFEKTCFHVFFSKCKNHLRKNSKKYFFEIFQKIFFIFKIIFFDEKIKVWNFVGPLNRNKIFVGIDFSHPQSDSTKLSIGYRADKKISSDFKGFPYHLRSDNDLQKR